MGIKGAKDSGEAALAVQQFTNRLAGIAGISSKKMFGGFGVFHEGKMFALVNSKGQIFLKADDTIKQKFVDAGTHSHGRMPYFSLSENVIEDQDQLVQWAQESINISKG